jgi:hypothetical protein
VLILALAGHAAAQDPTPGNAQDIYREVLAWSRHIPVAEIPNRAAELDELYNRIERSAFRYNLIPEFALAVVAAENRYGGKISWARHDSWAMWENTTGNRLDVYPDVYNDLDTCFSELRMLLSDCQSMDEVYSLYWCGPGGEFNPDSLNKFREAVSKLFSGLMPLVEARQQNSGSSKYNPYSYNNDSYSSSSNWARLAYGDLGAYSSSMQSMPLLAEQLHSFGRIEDAYVAVARHYNKNLSSAEAVVIVRAILTYCEQTEGVVDPRLIMAMVAAESSFRPEAVSPVGAMGLGQLMPATAKSFGIKDAFDPVQNLYGCVRYVEREIYRWQGNSDWLDLVIASYNAGAGAVQKYNGIPPYRETQGYVKRVKKYYQQLAPELEGI